MTLTPIKSKTFTDRMLGQNILSQNIATATTVDDDEVLKEKIRNKIIFWSCIVGGFCQVANLLYVTFFIK